MKKLVVSTWTVLGQHRIVTLPDGEQRFDSSSANPKDCETDSVSELFVVVPRKRPGVSSVDMLDTMASDAELNVEQTTGTPVLDRVTTSEDSD